MILISKNIYRGVGDKLESGFVAVKGDKILHVGSMEQLPLFMEGETEVYDFGEKPILPGFHDGHLHAFMSGLYADPRVRVCYTDESEEACVAGLKEIEDRNGRDEWMISAGWNHSAWAVPKLPTKYSLDAVYPDRPVCMVSFDCHTMWINSCGLKKLGFDRNTPDIPGGIIDRDEKGELLGTFHEGATARLCQLIYQFPEEQIAGFYENFMKIMNRYGITSICDMSMMAVPGLDFIRDDIYKRMEQEGTLSVRVHMYPTMVKGMERAMKMRNNCQGPYVYCNGVKQFFDGVSCCHTAFLRDEYANPYFPGDHGKPTVDPEVMRSLVQEAHKNDFSIRVHTIGDQAIHLMLDYCQEAEMLYGEKPYLRHTLEHLENFIPEDIPRLGRSHVLPSVQPAHVLCDITGVERDLGPVRSKLMWPFRRMLDAGSTLAFGTDSPVVDINPFESLYNAVTRQSAFDGMPKGGWLPNERISIFEAVSAYTYGSACGCCAEHLYGTLAANMYADICVLDRNIFEEEPEALLETSCLMTILGGKVVYKKEA